MKHSKVDSIRRIGPWLSIVAVILSLVVTVMNHPKSVTHAAQSSDWPTYLANDARTSFNSAEKTLNKTTISQLKVHWMARAKQHISAEPVVANGLVYWGSRDGIEHATNLSTGQDVWATNLGETIQVCNNTKYGIFGTATVTQISINGVLTPVLFVGGGDVQLYALNANTGSILWNTRLGTQPDFFLFSTPLVFQNSVYMGVSSHGDCPLTQGQFVQLDTTTGTIQHIFKIVPDGCVGGSVWGSPSFDARTNTIYFATGNEGACSTTETMTDSLIAVNAADLSLVGMWQIPLSQTVVDSDFGSTPTFFEATINNVLHHMLALINKNGIYYAFDRSNISAGPIWQVRLADPRLGHGKSIDISSSVWDGTNLYEAAGTTVINGQSCQGGLRALNPATGRFIWEACLPVDPLGPIIGVPGLVVVGVGPALMIFDAKTGAQLFNYQDSAHPTTSNFLGPASISDGILYAGNMDNYLYAFGL